MRFNTNEYLRKLIVVWDCFGPRDSGLNRIDSYLLSGKLQVASQIYSELLARSHTREADEEFWLGFLDRNLDATVKSRKCERLVSLLDRLEVPLVPSGSRAYKEALKKLDTDFGRYESCANDWVERIFGFRLPTAIDIAFNLRDDPGIRGASLASKPILISLQCNLQHDAYVSVLFHEMLHSQLRRPELAQCISPPTDFEEALLDYFTVGGIIDKKVGLSKELDLEQHQRLHAAMRPSSADISLRLLPVIKEYYRNPRGTIWDRLRETEFAKYLKCE